MKNRIVLMVAVGALGAAEPVLAIPAFARRYAVECHFCHEGYPKLNAMGQRFKERGFRMEPEPDFDAAAWLRSVPISVRPDVNRFFIEKGDATTSGFIRGIAAGSLGRRLSFWVDDGLLITEGDDNFTHTKPDNAYARLDLVPGRLYVRGGRIELDLPFTQTRTSHLFSYDIYFANTGFETDAIGLYQEGAEVGGSLPADAHWSAALVKGRNSEDAEALSSRTDRFDANVFLRASKRIQRNRVGAFAYIGRNTLATTVPPLVGTGPVRVITWDDDILRLGGDLSLWIERLNLYGVYMYGRNSNSIADGTHLSGTNQRLSFNGGFVQADLHVREWIALTGRFNVVSQPVGNTSTSKETFSGVFPGVQIWPHERLKLSFEYGLLNRDRRNFGAVQAELVL
jgi:hypothetical protein